MSISVGVKTAGRLARRPQRSAVLATVVVMTLGVAACTSGTGSNSDHDADESSDPVTTRVALEGITRVDQDAELDDVLFVTDGESVDLSGPLEFDGDDPLVVARDPLTSEQARVAEAARAEVIELGDADPQIDSAPIEKLRGELDRPTLVLGDKDTAAAVTTARRYAPLPTGTYQLFDSATHYIGLYGHPNTARLGVLGEQGPAKSVKRLEKLLAEYAEVAPDASFHGVFEIIATVATGGPGERGMYSQDTPVEDLEPLVDAAAEAGMIVLLDLQPGREDFLTQAKRYEPLLARPHVGLALDPEWRLGKDQVHLRQIGSVRAAEVNQTANWLADLVREHSLPQKLFVVHQFHSSMIRDRGDLDTSHPELATVIHVDGQGSRHAKFATWRHLLKGTPAGVHWGWKNFIDEDPDMLSPKETWQQVDPKPALITYQ